MLNTEIFAARPGELSDLSLAECAALLERREISPVELLNACLDRIAALDSDLHAFITVAAASAMTQAQEAQARLERGERRGELDGIPLALKDNIETAQIRTTSNSKLLLDRRPTQDAAVVTRLHAAGAVIVGKTELFEFAHGGPAWDLPWPPAVNPWDPRRLAGGSSSGSAVAVSARMVPAALGTDTGGSVRWPAAMCGITGLKPTYGRISRRGVHPNSFSQDHCGVMARTVEDCALLLKHLAGHDALDPGSIDEPLADYHAALSGTMRGLKVGVIRHWYAQHGTPAVRAAVDAAVARLQAEGAIVEEVELAPLEDYNDCKTVLSTAELYAVHGDALKSRPQDFGALMRSRLFAGAFVRADDYLRAARWRAQLARGMFQHFRRFDVLLTAGWLDVAELNDPDAAADFTKKPLVTVPFSLAGNPALCVPCGLSEEGLPLSLQIAGRPFDEAGVLFAGHAYQHLTDWHLRVPPISERPRTA